MSPRTGARRRLGSIRLSLILLALVPSVTLAAMWGVTTTQIFSEGLRLRAQTELSRSTGAMGTEATLALQQERSLSAAWLASPHGSRTALDRQRRTTDTAVAKLVRRSDDIKSAPARIGDRLYSVLASVGSLEYYRGQVDHPTDITAQQALDQYTAIIDGQINAFQELSQVDDGDLTSQAGPLITLGSAAELVAQEDAELALAWPSGKLDEKAWTRFAQLVDVRRWVFRGQVLSSLDGAVKTRVERILQSPDFKTLENVEDQVVAARTAHGTVARTVPLPDAGPRWNAALARISAQYSDLIRQQTAGLLDRSADKADGLLVKAAALSAGGLVALLLCVVMSWRITRSLSRRLRGLRLATLSLAEERLPDVVSRLDRGEKVDVDLAAPPLDYGGDELGQVAQAFNTAQRTAVHTAVELADTRRGFQKVILGIARQSQNLVNLQLSRLDAMEREHQDPRILKGLYELDSTASQLRRYEENLVIISGEQPRRSWTEPVALIDILRSAVGEVAQYQRVEVHADDEVCLTPPAVADVIHLLAELIDNATAYSPAPSPVGVRAAMVAKGLAVEIEDRGLGLSEEDYAAFNSQLAVSPQFDVVALADDLRLGMFVIARLATRHGITVTLRSSPYGGTTAIVLIPHEIVVRETPGPSARDADPMKADPMKADPMGADPMGADPMGMDPMEADAPGTAPAGTGPDAAAAEARPAHERTGEARPAARARTADPAASRSAASRSGAAPATAAARRDGRTPLPRRVPQTSLATELREDAGPANGGQDTDGLADFTDLAEFTAERAASSLAGFQRGTLRARDAHDDEEPYDPGEQDARRARKEGEEDPPDGPDARGPAAERSRTAPADRSSPPPAGHSSGPPADRSPTPPADRS
ncbi:nitrate- and nitrite sensing domain-containing protein [Streptomyces sp. NPDC096934]|uniref:nitrate- and nitrite sensing domain-containing protein n=1 Tax=Streptomyces sp. NPDC096934 TaxID=3155551 RepID=UPI003319F23D